MGGSQKGKNRYAMGVVASVHVNTMLGLNFSHSSASVLIELPPKVPSF